MRFTYIMLVNMSQHELLVAAVDCMIDALCYWPSELTLPDPDPFVITEIMHSMTVMPEDISRYYLQPIPPPSTWLIRTQQLKSSENRLASLVLCSLRAAMRAFVGSVRQDPAWGRKPVMGRQHWIAWLAEHPIIDPASEIMDAQKFIAELERVSQNL